MDQSAIAEHGHEDRDLPCRGADIDPAAIAPIDLHRLARLIMDFLVDPPACRPDRAQDRGEQCTRCQYSHRGRERSPSRRALREFRILGHQGVDLGLVESEGLAQRTSTGGAGGLIQSRAPRPRDVASTEVNTRSPGRKASRPRPGGESQPIRQRSWQAPFAVSLSQRGSPAQDLTQLHQALAGLRGAALVYSSRESTWVKRVSWAIRSRASSSSRAAIKAGRLIRTKAAIVPSA